MCSNNTETWPLGRCILLGFLLELLLFVAFVVAGAGVGPSDSFSFYWLLALSQAPAGIPLNELKKAGANIPQPFLLLLVVILQTCLFSLAIWLTTAGVPRLLRRLSRRRRGQQPC